MLVVSLSTTCTSTVCVKVEFLFQVNRTFTILEKPKRKPLKLKHKRLLSTSEESGTVMGALLSGKHP